MKEILSTRKSLLLLMLLFSAAFSVRVSAQQNINHLLLSVGALYERGLDATVAYEHSTRYHNAWEFFGNYYIQYDIDPVAGHYTKESFWNSYNTWLLGICYKPCVNRTRNNHGNVRIGGCGGSDQHKFIGGVNIGYEHSFALYHGVEFFFQLREDIIFRTDDIFRTGGSIGFKIPL